jgi:quercetin dioxygenase-like cupin family protein
MRLALVVALFCLTFCPNALARRTSDTPGDASAWSLDSIPWGERAADGSRFALLEGERETAGQSFSYAFAIPAGLWDSPHSHSTTARIFVAKGTLHLGYGTQMDRTKARAYPAGSYLVVPAGAVHFDGSDEETVILGVASGAWSTRYINASAQGSAGTPPPR